MWRKGIIVVTARLLHVARCKQWAPCIFQCTGASGNYLKNDAPAAAQVHTAKGAGLLGTAMATAARPCCSFPRLGLGQLLRGGQLFVRSLFAATCWEQTQTTCIDTAAKNVASASPDSPP